MAETETPKLDKENIQFNNATEFVQQTNELLYLTGKAGTGKTTFLKHIKKITEKNTVILAPTGVAAINAGGVTIHSFFQIPFGPFLPNDLRLRTNSFNTESKETIYTTFKYQEDKKKIIENLELLIIDEISMVRCDILDIIDKILRVFRKINHLPFGGVQVILIGDTFQLPPIANGDEWSILSQFYKTPFFFSSKVIEQNKPPYIELKKIYRQNEQEFIDLLNRVRVNKVNSNDFSILNSKYNPTFSSNGSDYIILATHNRIVNQTNLTKLNQLETKIHTFEANVNKIFPDKIMPTDRFLKLKVGAQIMFIKNDIGDNKRYYNGKIGKIKELEDNKIVVVFDNEQEVEVESAEWKNIKYTYNKEKKKIEEEIIGTFEQYPIRLAWAITVHKSQGLTFEKVIADLGSAFTSGQVYVALSRCTSFSGLVLKSQLHQNAIKTDLRVLEFAKNETPSTLIAEQLSTGKADFNYKKSREYYNKGKFAKAFTFFKKALKFRNDIETDIFEKFIVTSSKKLFSYKDRYRTEKENLFTETEKTTELQGIVTNQIEIIDNNDTKIIEQNDSLKLLNEKIENLETEVTNLSKIKIEQTNTITSIVNEFEEQKIHISKLQNKVQLKKSEIKQIANRKSKLNELLTQEREKFKKDKELQTNENTRLITEISRIKSLKWYDKLIGKK
tara:strand:- start:693 stop:2714 length:2022 start_codon:yes stop_codon:yes gene_type:complete